MTHLILLKRAFLLLYYKNWTPLTSLHDISIWLDTYDDIFSDFDYRPFSDKALSDDFIDELQKVYREKEEVVNEVKLFLPEDQRNSEDEKIITKRLHTHFTNNHLQYKDLSRKLLRKGVLFTLFGIIMMLIASYVSSLHSEILIINALLVIFEPAGWFLLWSGLDIIFDIAKQNKKELDFYSKLSKSKISFFTI